MKEIANEINKLAEEILSEKTQVDSLIETFQVPTSSPTKGEKIGIGFNLMQYNSKLYAFKRFYSLVPKELLSEIAIKVFEENKTLLEEISIIKESKDIPEELKEFLGK